MNTFEELLREIEGGRVLDVATQEGYSARTLAEHLAGFVEVIGVDIHEPAIEKARERFGPAGLRFLVMNGENLDFEDASFDTVSMSASLHHLPNPGRVLREMLRVLKPGGAFILLEMHHEVETPPELTSVHLHHWAAAVDTATGRAFHRPTLARREFRDCVEGLELSGLRTFEFDDRDSDPLDPERLEALDAAIGKVIQRAEAAAEAEALRERGEAIRRRLREAGAWREPVLVAIGRKPARGGSRT